jgi:hypothetical protein
LYAGYRHKAETELEAVTTIIAEVTLNNEADLRQILFSTLLSTWETSNLTLQPCTSYYSQRGPNKMKYGLKKGLAVGRRGSSPPVPELGPKPIRGQPLLDFYHAK